MNCKDCGCILCVYWGADRDPGDCKDFQPGPPFKKDDQTVFHTGAVRDAHTANGELKGRMDLLPWIAIMEVSKLCEKGALHYGAHNVDRGIPIHSFIDSAIRHTVKFWTHWEDEPHLTAACWNLLWALQMMLKKPEMDDRP